MKICIPFKIKDVGGSSTFVKNFVTQLKQNGIEITHNPKEYADIFFVMSSRPLKEILDAKRRGSKIVQRLDGTYYYRVKGATYPLWNMRMKFIHNYLADFVIYQSEFSKFLCNKFLGTSKKPWTIIKNGVDTQLFSPQITTYNLRDFSSQKILFTVSQFRHEDMITPLIEAACLLRSRRQDFKLIIAGDFTSSIDRKINRFKNLPYIQFLGTISNHELPHYEAGADLFLFSNLSACPNVVIEALSSGLPVVAFGRGGVNELIDAQSGIVVPHSQKELYRLKKFDLQTFATGINTVLNNLEYYKKNARQRAVTNYSIETMMEQYIQIFQSLINK